MNIDKLSVNTARFLAVEAIQKANSGHPGLPLGAAPALYTLWAKQMKHNPKNSKWLNRDRFVLSAGHGSALLYSMLHLFGYSVSIEDLKNFRQHDSLTPGHPEFGYTDGVEITTGPLGQGIANAVGFALAESYLAAKFNREGFNVVDHYTFALCGDGCLMEGISSEAASLAGTLKLGKLILIYDSNNITIEGDTSIAFTENVLERFKSYGWQTIKVDDGSDLEAINSAIIEAKSNLQKPAIIEVKTKIGAGSPNKEGKPSAHGEPLGIEEIKLTKKALGFEYFEDFYVPEDVIKNIESLQINFAKEEQLWNNLFDNYKKEFPDLADELVLWFSKDLPYDFLNDESFWNNEGDIASRVSSEKILNRVSKVIPNLIGGSADLAPSTKTVMQDRSFYSCDNKSGSNLHFGIREHAMTAIANGMAAHGGLRPYISGFLVFSDYMKPAMRLSAMMKLPVISILTHDSIGVGEDGATHQPIEQIGALRMIPNFIVMRPADFNETAASWYVALSSTEAPVALILTRQNLPLLKGSGKGALKGAYIIRNSKKEIPDVILMASGSEVSLIYDAYDKLAEKGIDARVVSFPSFELFEQQSDDYKESVLPRSVRKRLAVEAASPFGWHKYIGIDGDIIAMNGYGGSAPANLLFEEFGFTVDNIVERAAGLM